MRLEIAPQVSRDLEKIARYIAKDKPGASAAFVNKIIDEFEVIADHPHLFARSDGMRPDFRRALVGPYQIVYRITTEFVRIERVIHGMRKLPSRFR